MADSNDKVTALKSEVLAERDAAQKQIDSLDELNAQITKDIDAAYDEGVKDNQAAVGNSDGKIYSLEEANQIRDEAMKPLQDQLADMGVKLADLQAKVDAAPDVETAKKEAREELKQQILAESSKQQSSESEGEANLKSFIESL